MINRGENTREATKLEILRFLLDGKERRGEEIVDAVNKSKKTVYKYRAELVEDRQVEMLPVTPRDTRPRYRITEKGRRDLLNQSAKNLSSACQIFEQLLKRLQKPENTEKWRKKGTLPDWPLGMPKRIPVNADPDAPAAISFYTEEENLELSRYREKAFGVLDRVFFDLAKVVMKVDVGFIDAEEDLSNVTTRYHNRRAVWSVNASIKPQTHIMLKDGDEWIAVEKEKFNKATRSEKTVNEILEQERTDRRQNQGS